MFGQVWNHSVLQENTQLWPWSQDLEKKKDRDRSAISCPSETSAISGRGHWRLPAEGQTSGSRLNSGVHGSWAIPGSEVEVKATANHTLTHSLTGDLCPSPSPLPEENTTETCWPLFPATWVKQNQVNKSLQEEKGEGCNTWWKVLP